MPMDLGPAAMARVLAALDVAHALVLDVARGKSIVADDVVTVRQAFVSARQVLDALDDAHPWTP